jgi:hypothetical protein
MDDKPSARADLVSAVVWLIVGGAIVYGSWTMDRLAYLNINPYTVPGLVPGVLGAALMIMALVLLARALRQEVAAEAGPAEAVTRLDAQAGRLRLLLALALTLGFGAGLVGRGPPFWLAAWLFIALFVFLFEFPERRARRQIGRGVAVALVHGLISALAIHFVFQELFLVRLP